MIEKGNRSQGIPFFISNSNTQKLERIPLTEKLFQEEWIQKLIFENPQILPVDNLEIGFTPLIPLGREISTSVGFIDNLFISSDGYLTIVETKLWRNPEAKREVVGQIIDYAKDLTNWTFDKLNSEVKNRNSENKGIIEAIRELEELDEEYEAKLIDNIERNLKRGRFLLLIVGDGIRESVEDMVDYLSNSAQLLFTLGLVELQVYKAITDESYIVVPNLITRTKEITRAIIKIENSTNSIVKVESNFSEPKNSNTNTRTTITEVDFFDELENNTDSETAVFAKQILEQAIKSGYHIDWNSGSFSVKILDPNGSGQKITMFVVDRKGMFYIGWSGTQLKRLGLDYNLSSEYVTKTAKLLPNIQQDLKHKDFWNRNSNLKDLRLVYNEFMAEVEKYKDLIIKKSEAIANII
ncbi:hypothetical protein [Aestuariivivens sediminicola]|uniref:hypothetical protein n=1 Tax=Aestuariivivens sediminicola TaxID=2913560 RepID=UPI001F56BE13|nr:hypothetical protein [Aestuariivivens sediminicola]